MILSLLWGDRAKARTLQKLSQRTVDMMRSMISNMEASDDRVLIENHLRKRIQSSERYAMLARGDSDSLEQLSPTIQHYQVWKRSMEEELSRFGKDSRSFARYLREISKP